MNFERLFLTVLLLTEKLFLSNNVPSYILLLIFLFKERIFVKSMRKIKSFLVDLAQ